MRDGGQWWQHTARLRVVKTLHDPQRRTLRCMYSFCVAQHDQAKSTCIIMDFIMLHVPATSVSSFIY